MVGLLFTGGLLLCVTCLILLESWLGVVYDLFGLLLLSYYLVLFVVVGCSFKLICFVVFENFVCCFFVGLITSLFGLDAYGVTLLFVGFGLRVLC